MVSVFVVGIFHNILFGYWFGLCCNGRIWPQAPAKHLTISIATTKRTQAAMNDGADAGNGHLVGVIHEMFLADGNDWLERDGGAHSVFANSQDNISGGPTREILIAGGNDLQERKRLLVEGDEALVVLPGGPGTFDELWEMVCARNLGLTNLPIVCVSVDGYYEAFCTMLARAYAEGLVKNKPENLVHFVSSAEEAVRWVESRKGHTSKETALPKVQTRKSVLRKTSFFAPPTFLSKSMSWISDMNATKFDLWDKLVDQDWTVAALTFSAGLGVGFLSAKQLRHR